MRSIGITAMSTGSGKTSVTSALLYSLNMPVQVKVGPDFIDPLVLKGITGRKGYNIDRWIQGKNYLDIPKLASQNNDYAVYEGVMGFYDSGLGRHYSTKAYFEKLNVPYVLVVDVLKYGESIYYNTVGFKGKSMLGVILNRYSTERHLELVEKPFKEHGVRVLGSIPFREDLEMKERHLGINVEDGQKKALHIGKEISRYLDTDFVEDLEDREYEGVFQEDERKSEMKIAIAMDNAFNFYYRNSLDYLERNFNVEYFSPIHNEVPKDPDFVYIGGGYPELHGEELENATDTVEFLREFNRNGGRIYSECGGTMYLLETLETGDKRYRMAGVFSGKSHMEKRPILSYTELNAEVKNPLFPVNYRIRGHEFHYSRIETKENMAFSMKKGQGIDGRDGILKRNSIGMYTHIDMMRYGKRIFEKLRDRS
ncbi:cobyrinate a,c-diamide synthase [Cuniculiplasma sp. SKW4]|uniref:cobyrinate a,c-diamide synthase n=1 Tax=Cuniculiplasma sp. SKW4 TaxID=3400171 RepID=UPI003FD4F058